MQCYFLSLFYAINSEQSTKFYDTLNLGNDNNKNNENMKTNLRV